MKNLLFIALFMLTSNTFADDIWFISPQAGQTLQNVIKIQIQPPYHKGSVRVWIESDMGREQMVWSGQLTPENNYSTSVDVSKFNLGKYKIEAQYYIRGEDYDGDIEVWIGGTPNNNSQQQQFYN